VIRIEIAYAEQQHSVVKSLEVEQGALIADALRLAALDEDFRGVDLVNATVGIYGSVASRDRPLKDGDRIEIYRPLAEEPKLARRKRARRDDYGGVRSNADIKPSRSGRS
jgi:putative ubiquitin-RnfH superfamily antitoxin RatB of RatAB toxin-antitoxin module